MQSRIEVLPQARKTVVVTIDAAEKAAAESKALEKLASSMKLPGFRPGKAPTELLKEKIEKEKLLEETVRALLPDVMKHALDSKDVKPIMQPSISVGSVDPLTIHVTIVERPEVKVKGAKKISIKKEPIADPSPKEIDRFVDMFLEHDRAEKDKDGPAASGDAITISMEGKDANGVPLTALTTERYSLQLGKEDILPELETHLLGMKKGDTKTVTIDFPPTHEVQDLRGKKATVTLSVQGVREVSLPTLTSEYLEKRLKAKKSVEEFRADISRMLKDQRKQHVMQQREEDLLKAVKEATTVDLAPELVNVEAQIVLDGFIERLKKQGLTFDDWLKSTGKDPKLVGEEVKTAARDRLTLRFGMHEVVKERDITVTDDDVHAFIHQGVSSDHDHADHAPGTPLFEDAKSEVKIRKFISEEIAEKAA